MKTLPLTKGLVALVDDDDYYWLSQWNWFVSGKERLHYASRSKKKTPMRSGIKYETLLHRIVMRCTDPGLVVDHIDHNTLNCQKHNLRICTKAENNRNLSPRSNTVSKYLGVTYCTDKHRKLRWKAQVAYNGERVFGKRFMTEEEAARAYDVAALYYFKEFANLNFKNDIDRPHLDEILSVRHPQTMSEEHKKMLAQSRAHIDFTKLHRDKRGKRVVNSITGEVYTSLAEAAEILGTTKSMLSSRLLGKRPNRTNLIYL